MSTEKLHKFIVVAGCLSLTLLGQGAFARDWDRDGNHRYRGHRYYGRHTHRVNVPSPYNQYSSFSGYGGGYGGIDFNNPNASQVLLNIEAEARAGHISNEESNYLKNVYNAMHR